MSHQGASAESYPLMKLNQSDDRIIIPKIIYFLLEFRQNGIGVSFIRRECNFCFGNYRSDDLLPTIAFLYFVKNRLNNINSIFISFKKTKKYATIPINK